MANDAFTGLGHGDRLGVQLADRKKGCCPEVCREPRQYPAGALQEVTAVGAWAGFWIIVHILEDRYRREVQLLIDSSRHAKDECWSY